MLSSRNIFAKRRLKDLVSIGPRTVHDLELLGITTVEELAKQDPKDLYRRLKRYQGPSLCICCQDVFSAAVAQAKDPNLAHEKCVWWYWTKVRKQAQ
jgi:nucleotidyltransferase/DNA polymerase involved in DNA repair